MEIEHICGKEEKMTDIANLLLGGKCNYTHNRDVAIITMKEDIDMYANFFHKWHRVFETDIRYWVGTFVLDGKTRIVFTGPHGAKYREEWTKEMNSIFNNFKEKGLIYCGDIKFFPESLSFFLHDDEG